MSNLLSVAEFSVLPVRWTERSGGEPQPEPNLNNCEEEQTSTAGESSLKDAEIIHNYIMSLFVGSFCPLLLCRMHNSVSAAPPVSLMQMDFFSFSKAGFEKQWK